MFKMRLHVLIINVLGLLLLSACNLQGAGVAKLPAQPFSNDAIKAVAKRYTQTTDNKGDPIQGSWIAKAQECSSGSAKFNCESFRNGMIFELMTVINHNYQSYEGNLIAGRAKSDFYSNTGRSVLETGATLIDPAGVKTVLSALATLTGNVNDNAQRSFYFEQSSSAITKIMRANRAQKTAEIFIKMTGPYDQYPVMLAIQDLDDLFRAGTIASAVISLDNAAQDVEKEANTLQECVEISLAAERRECLTKPAQK